MLGTGAGLLIQHRRAYARFQVAPDNEVFVAALNASAAGAGLVGAGLGLGGAAITAGLGADRRWLWGELGVGGGLALIGAAWYARDWQRVQRDLYGVMDSGSPDLKAQHRETAAAAVLGAGVGLAVGAGVALVTRHRVGRRVRVSAGADGLRVRF
jgi:uncharacterized membrane protein